MTKRDVFRFLNEPRAMPGKVPLALRTDGDWNELYGRFEDREADNLLATIPGRGAELVVLSAHIDGHDLACSAIDNATGLAAALCIAEALRDIVPALPRGRSGAVPLITHGSVASDWKGELTISGQIALLKFASASSVLRSLV